MEYAILALEGEPIAILAKIQARQRLETSTAAQIVHTVRIDQRCHLVSTLT